MRAQGMVVMGAVDVCAAVDVPMEALAALTSRSALVTTPAPFIRFLISETARLGDGASYSKRTLSKNRVMSAPARSTLSELSHSSSVQPAVTSSVMVDHSGPMSKKLSSQRVPS